MNMTIEYKGNETENEIYKLTINSIEELVKIATNKQELRSKLQNLLAIVENEISNEWVAKNRPQLKKSDTHNQSEVI